MAKPTRAYNSENRQSQAAQTRERILQAAKRLFQTEGFDQVTIGKLAKAAEVSAPTIYAVFKSKRGVLQALMDEALPSDQFSALVDQSMQGGSPVNRLRITAKMARQIYDAERELMDVLRGASVVSPEVRELEQEREQRRHDRQAEYVSQLYQEKVLLPELTLDKARDIVWALTGRDLYRMLVMDRGWTPDEYEKWLAEQMARAVLKPSA